MTQHPAHVSEQAAPPSAPPLGQFYEVGGRGCGCTARAAEARP